MATQPQPQPQPQSQSQSQPAGQQRPLWGWATLCRHIRAWGAVLKMPHMGFLKHPHLWWLEYFGVSVAISILGQLLDTVPLPVYHPFTVVTVAELILMIPVLVAALRWGWGPGLCAAIMASFWWYRITPYYDEVGALSNTSDALSIFSAGIVFLLCAFIIGAVATHSQQQRQHLRDAVERYRDLNIQKEEFLSVIAHELRTPLTAATMAIQLSYRLSENVEQLSLDERRRRGEELQEVLSQQMTRMTNLLQDVTEAVRVANNKVRYDPTEFDIGELVENTVAEARVLFPARTFFYKRPYVRLYVAGDVHRVGQVLHNYISNAVKFSEPVYPIAISCLREDDKVVVAVRDSGVGIAKEQQEAIWGRFYQIKDAASPQQDSSSYIGFGVGLYVVRSLIEAMGGNVGLYSALGGGSQFWFSLPLSDSREVLRDTSPSLAAFVPINAQARGMGQGELHTLRPQPRPRPQP